MPMVENLMKMQMAQSTKLKTPVWSGPDGQDQNGGITQGLLNRWLSCRERCRVYLVEGLKPVDTFNVRLEYGNFWHLMEENLAGHQCYGDDSVLFAEQALLEHASHLCRKYPMQQEEISKWWQVCKLQFRIYVDFWSRHPDTVERTPLLQEHEFSVPYKLPSGRTVRLRGKWDGVDLVGKEKPGLYLFESKTKSDIDEVAIKRQLAMDLQTMFYAVSLQESLRQHWQGADVGLPEEALSWPQTLAGVRYNVVRRPLSGGKGSIVQKAGKPPSVCSACKGTRRTPKGQKLCGRCKGRGQMPGVPGETTEQYHARLAQYITDEPTTYFHRWTVGITAQDIQRFRRQFLDPCLEQMCDWWSWVKLCVTQGGGDPFSPDDGCENVLDQSVRSSIHYRSPYGAGDNWWSADIDAYIDAGMTAGLERTDRIFPELGGD
jgi:hypothetical protein